MRDRQVEVVPGNHVLVRVAGVVVLVAHREDGPVHDDSAAVRAAEALSQLAFEAAEQNPGGPGRLLAREAANWLSREPGQRIELGILSQADTGGVAIFLHGAVTAALAGEHGVEYLRGADAPAVDRVVESPARAAAIFVDEGPGEPRLPARGIGALVEGVAPASGAIVWFEARRSRARERDAGIAPVAPEAPPPLPHNVHSAPADSGHTAPPDPALADRVAETERAAALTVHVLGFKCARAHPSDPRSAFCTVCGMPVDQTQPPSDVLRPPLGTLVLDDGTTFTVAADAVLGRDPQHSDAAQRGLMPFKIEDNSGGMSRAHAEIHLVNWDVTIVDRGSTNGTQIRPPGYDWIRLQPGRPIALIYGTEIMLGNRALRFDPITPPPFG